MTIKEIKEWRGSKHHGLSIGVLSVIDTLLEEVATLEKHNAYADQYNTVQDLHLTIATEALERIQKGSLGKDRDWCKEVARTALDRIKEC